MLKIFQKLVLFLFLMAFICVAAENPQQPANNTLSKTSLDKQVRSILNIPNWGLWMRNDGQSAHDPSNNAGGFYPRGTAAAIYLDGIVWGGYLRDAVERPLRVGGQTFNIGTAPGWIDGSGNAVSPDHERAALYRIRTDWRSLETNLEALRRDASEVFVTTPANVTDAQLQETFDQYKHDWINWPVDLGAPYVDVDNNGVYNPVLDGDGAAMLDGDHPGYANADQLIWFVVNDFDPDVSKSIYGSDPLNIELQITLWGYNQPNSTLGQILFKRFLFINKGTSHIDSMYVAQWSDPDVGAAGNDLAGCDIEESIGYAYNGQRTDGDYDVFGLPPVAVGYDFFAGPLVEGVAGQDLNNNGVDDSEDVGVFNLKYVEGHINLPMTSFLYFAAGSAISDPPLGEYDGTLQWYNMLNGFTPTTDLNNPTPYVVGAGPDVGEPTKYPLSGDPFRGSGDVDNTGSNFGPGDRRIGMASGPFTMAPGDTQEVVVGVVGGIITQPGGDNRNAVAQMKLNDRYAQFLYDKLFSDIPRPPTAPVVKATAQDGKVFLDWGSSVDKYAETEAPGVLGFNFEGYNVYQLPEANSDLSSGVLIATYDVINGIQIIRGEQFVPSYGDILSVPVQRGTDSGIKRYISIDRDYVNDRPLFNGNTYHFVVTAYNYSADPALPIPTLESPFTVFSLVPQGPNPGVIQGSELGDLITIDHPSGVADGRVQAMVLDYAQLTGHNYNVSFEPWHYYRDLDGVWKRTNYPDSVGKFSLLKGADVSGSTITGSAIASASVGTVDLVFTLDLVSPNGAWVDGLKIDLPPGITVNSWTDPSGDYNSFGTGQGQNTVNVSGTYDAVENSITWGDSARSEFGAFEGTVFLTINVDPFTFPQTFGYEVYDDGFTPANIIDAAGTLTITELGYEFRTDNTWKITDMVSSEVKLDGQTQFYTLSEPYPADAPVVDGIQIVVRGFFDTPINFASVTIQSAVGTPLTSSGSRTTLDIQNYTIFGGVISSYAIDNFGFGTTDLTELVKDYELRFTGVWDSMDVNGTTVHYVREGGQMATIFSGLTATSLPDHPLNPSPGSSDPFLIRIPFEVWCKDDNRQVNLMFRDREQVFPPASGPFYSWNINSRMYAVIVNSAYDENQPMSTSNTDATWVLVFYGTHAVIGDVVTVNYPNPLVHGSDIYNFTTDGLAETFNAGLLKAEKKKINVFPNPYYAYNPEEPNRYNRFVTFNHLPQKATIRIFDLAGNQVRKLDKDNSSQFFNWDLRNESDLPVASGMYIAHIDIPDVGVKVLKLMVIQAQEVLRYY
jgi:hypothetical protein